MFNFVRRGFVVICTMICLTLATQARAEDLSAKVKEAMAMLKEKAATLGAPKLEGATLKMGDTEINGNYDIVDEVADAKGCTATIFVAQDDKFVRVSTNVIKNGNRAIGTLLDPNGPAIVKIKIGEAYYGEADILGSKYETGYEPIKDGEGKVIGVLYVGYKI